MKKSRTSILLLWIGLITLFSLQNQSGNRFYYAYDKKIYIRQVPGKVFVKFSDQAGSEYLLSSVRSISGRAQIDFQGAKYAIITSENEDEKNQLMIKLKTEPNISSVMPLFQIGEGSELGVTDEFAVKFLDNVSEKAIQEINIKYNVTEIKRNDVYTLYQVPKNADAIEIANQYQESGLVLFSQPNFIVWIEKHQQVIPNDAFFNNQFYLNNVGQIFTDGHSGTADADIDAPEAWAITQGANIVIAVLDGGVTANHPDLPNARQVRLAGSNFGNGDANNPDPQANNSHGNTCAGIIAATQNNEGISGICPNCRIMPIRIFNDDCTGITVDQVAAAINFARNNGAHVISNSWGFVGPGSDDPNLHPIIVEAIRAATTQGRNNLGCVVVFSAGNNATNNGPVHFPSNVNVAGVLTVGASDRDDLKAFYSPLSNPASPNNQIIDVTAPSHRAYPAQIAGETLEIWSMDIPGNTGYNPYPPDAGFCDFVNPPAVGEQLPNAGVNFQSYTGRFGGTSAACPQVASITALILSVNPNLTQQQVFDLITNNADRVGGYVYTDGWSNELGFGRVNACRAVLNAISSGINGSFPPGACAGSTATFTASNSDVSGDRYSWQVSSGLEFVGSNIGSSVNIRIVGSGSQWIRLNVNAACGTRTLSTRTIPQGTATYSEPTVDGSPYIVGSCHGVCPGFHWARLTVNGASPFDMSWTLDPPGTVNWQWEPENSQIVFEVVPNWTTFPFSFTGTDGEICGPSDFTFCFISGPNCQQEFSYSLSPNPANDELTVTKNYSGGSADAPVESEIVIYNSSIEKVYSITSSDSIIKVPVENFPEGNYFLHIINREGILRKHLLIKR